MIAACFVLGLLIGSFLNVVVHRTPIILDRQWRRQCDELAGRETPAAPRFDLVVPRSACPACKAPIRAIHNVPVLSWLALRGRCASCKARISARYPLVELLTAVLSSAVAWRFGGDAGGLPLIGAALVLTWFLIALTFIDFDTQLLPDAMTLPLLWLGLAASVLGYTAAAPREAIIGALAGYLSLWSVYHLFRLATGKEGMGYGDFKLLAALGAWLGWQMLLPIILLSAAVGAITGIALIVVRGRDRNVPIPFGPFLAAAGWIALMWGPAIVNGYLGMFAAPR
ncbi:MAG: Type 4 prepilin-like proteins leader peptide-processing enzyme [Steroidobacteraceae bacterium]|nr:Type 4 prepilin-like proteins leader peptide-processing enzyme [Steroidobacteraceae bacterium]